MPLDRLYGFGYIPHNGHFLTSWYWPRSTQQFKFLETVRKAQECPLLSGSRYTWKRIFFLQNLFKIWNQLSKHLQFTYQSAKLDEHLLSVWWPGCSPWSGSGAATFPGCQPLSSSPPFTFQLFTCFVARSMLTFMTSQQFKTAGRNKSWWKLWWSVCLTRGYK